MNARAQVAGAEDQRAAACTVGSAFERREFDPAARHLVRDRKRDDEGSPIAHATSHPVIRSLEPGEDWSWCYVDEVAFVIEGIRGETRIPPSPLLT